VNRTWVGPGGAVAWLLVDVRNVVGSTPDGWWRDPEGACARLVDAVAGAAPDGLVVTAAVDGPASHRLPAGDRDGVEVVRAGRGRDAADDAIVALLGERPDAPGPVLLVTADRELRRRAGTARDDLGCVGPTWLRERLPG